MGGENKPPGLGNKMRMTLGLPMSAVMNCADNSGAKNLFVISVINIKGLVPCGPFSARVMFVCGGEGRLESAADTHKTH